MDIALYSYESYVSSASVPYSICVELWLAHFASDSEAVARTARHVHLRGLERVRLGEQLERTCNQWCAPEFSVPPGNLTLKRSARTSVYKPTPLSESRVDSRRLPAARLICGAGRGGLSDH